jgi:hypothetical protein
MVRSPGTVPRLNLWALNVCLLYGRTLHRTKRRRPFFNNNNQQTQKKSRNTMLVPTAVLLLVLASTPGIAAFTITAPAALMMKGIDLTHGTTLGAAPLFGYLMNIAKDTVSANFYIAEYINCRALTMTPAGSTAIFAGNGVNSNTDGPALTSATGRFGTIAVANDGTVYLNCANSLAVKKVVGGTMTTLAGRFPGTFNFGLIDDAIGANAAFKLIYGMKLMPDQSGIVLTDNHAVRLMSTTAPYGVTTLASMGALTSTPTPGFVNGDALNVALFQHPKDVEVLDNIVFIADSSNFAIRKLDLSASPMMVSTLAGTGAFGVVDGPVGIGAFPGGMQGLSLDPSTNVLYVTTPGTVKYVHLGDGTIGSIGPTHNSDQMAVYFETGTNMMWLGTVFQVSKWHIVVPTLTPAVTRSTSLTPESVSTPTASTSLAATASVDTASASGGALSDAIRGRHSDRLTGPLSDGISGRTSDVRYHQDGIACSNTDVESNGDEARHGVGLSGRCYLSTAAHDGVAGHPFDGGARNRRLERDDSGRARLFHGILHGDQLPRPRHRRVQRRDDCGTRRRVHGPGGGAAELHNAQHVCGMR